MPLPESREFDVPALIWIFLVNICPPSVLTAPQNWASSFGPPWVSQGPPAPRSFRESYHTTARFPVVGSSEIFGRNWLFVVLSSFTRTGLLHVAPSSSEKRTKMSVFLLLLGCSRVYTRYTRPLWGPPVRSQASPGSASTERSGCAGMKSNPPTCVSVTNTRVPKPAGPSPSGSTFTKSFPPPCPLSVSAQTCMTSPFGPIETSPYVQLFVPGITSGVMKLPTCPNPVTGAPVATIGPPPLNTSQTSPSPDVIVGWSTNRNRPRRSPLADRLFGVFAMFAMRLKLRPPSVLRAMGTTFPTL